MPHRTMRLFQIGDVDLIHVDDDGDAMVVVADTTGRVSLLPRCRSCNRRITAGYAVCDWEGGARTIKHAACPGIPTYIHHNSDEKFPDDS